MQILKRIISAFIIGLMLLSCSQETSSEIDDNSLFQNTDNAWYNNENTIEGNALGTYFIVKTPDDSLFISPKEIDAFFDEFNHELSTYVPTSLINEFNQKSTAIDLNKTKYFQPCFELSQKLYQMTNGSFDPSVFPIVELWKMIEVDQKVPSQQQIDSVLAFVGFSEGDIYTYKDGILSKTDERYELIFNAIAKGQAVDELAALLEQRGQKNYYVEIGGELKVKGLNDRNSKWLIGIDEPIISNTGLNDGEKRPIENYIEITNKALATSGNYRDFYELNGEVFGHTIDPVKGQPVNTNILSATVIADDVATADALATSFMVVGVDSALRIIENATDLNIDAYFLFKQEDGRIARAYTDGMLMYILDK